MTFQPRMNSVRHGVTVLEDLKWRSWNGVVADVWHARCEAGARGEYVSDHPRMFIVLDRVGGELGTRLSPDGAELPGTGMPNPLSFIPAGTPLWARAETELRIRHLDLHFSIEALSERLSEDLDPAQLAAPRLMFADERILSLARLIAAECGDRDRRPDLYGDGLILALLLDLLHLGRQKARRRSPLAAWQLRRVTDFIEDNCARSIRLQELAELVALSQSYFSHAFKASTGVPPHQWQMQARIRKVQAMLLSGKRPLTEIAAENGFADQAHFTRVFRQMVGETPAAWQRAHQP